jgi:predicted DNA-binding transcriptional regulator AlpA
MISQDIKQLAPDTVLTFRQWCELTGFRRMADVVGDDHVMSHKEWTKAAGISEKNGRELIERGDGPATVQLSPNRIGVRVSDYRAWLTTRTERRRKTA